MSERIKVARVAEMIGLSPRAVQKMADKIPSAARFGRLWTFREDAVRQWVASREEETCQKTSTGGAGFGGGGFNSTNATYARAYAQMIKPRRVRGLATGKTS